MLQLGIGLEDAGVLGQLAQLNARAGALGATFADAAHSAEVVQAQIALLGFTAAGTIATMSKSFAEFEKTATLTAFAATGAAKEGVRALSTFRKQALGMARDMAIPVQEAGVLRQQIAQLGLESERQRDKVAEAAAMLDFMGETTGDVAAESLFRLANIVSDTNEEMSQLMENSVGLGSALLVVADQSASGVDGMIEFMRKLQAAGVTADFTASELIAISGAVTDIDEGVREKVTSSIIRLFSTIIPQASVEFRDFFGRFATGIDETTRGLLATEDGLQRIFAEQPIIILQALSNAFLNLNKALQEGNLTFQEQEEIRRTLGLDNVRDIQTLATLGGNYEKLTRFVGLANEEFQTGLELGDEQTELYQRHKILIGQLAGGWQALRVEFETFAVKGGEVIRHALIPFMNALRELMKTINDNEDLLKLTTTMVTAVPLALTLGAIVKLAKALQPLRALAGFMFGGRAATAQVAGEQVFGGAIVKELPTPVRARMFAEMATPFASMVGALGGSIAQGGQEGAKHFDEVFEQFARDFPKTLRDSLEQANLVALQQDAIQKAAGKARRRSFLFRPFEAVAAALGLQGVRRFNESGELQRGLNIPQHRRLAQVAVQSGLVMGPGGTVEGVTPVLSDQLAAAGLTFKEQQTGKQVITFQGRASGGAVGQRGTIFALKETQRALDRAAETGIFSSPNLSNTQAERMRQFLIAGGDIPTARRTAAERIGSVGNLIREGNIEKAFATLEEAHGTAAAEEAIATAMGLRLRGQKRLATRSLENINNLRQVPIFGGLLAGMATRSDAMTRLSQQVAPGVGQRGGRGIFGLASRSGGRAGIAAGLFTAIAGGGAMASPEVGALLATMMTGIGAERAFGSKIAGRQLASFAPNLFAKTGLKTIGKFAIPGGQLLGIIGLLTPLFGKLADTLDKVGGKKEGALSVLIEGLELAARLLQTVGNLVEFVFDLVFRAFELVFQGVSRGLEFLGIDVPWNSIGDALNSLNTNLKEFNQGIEGTRANIRGDTNVTVNVQGGEQGTAESTITRIMEDAT